MLTLLVALVIVASIGFAIFQLARYGFVSPASAFYRFMEMLPAWVTAHLPSPGFGTLERLIVGEIARTRTTSMARVVGIPCRFAVALSPHDWETVKGSPGYFLSDTATAAEELAKKRGWGIEVHVALDWTKRVGVPTGCPSVISIGRANTPAVEAQRIVTTNGPLARAELEAKSKRSKNAQHSEKGAESAGPVVQARPIDTLVLEPLQADNPTIFMVPHMRNLLIGRDDNADVVIDHKEVSRRQCGIERVDDRFVVSDLGSTNGTRVNGAVVGAGTAISVGDVLELARTVSYRRT
jgi:hypothetical protein